MSKLSIIIPAHNEENSLGETLGNYISYFSNKSGIEFEILVVCDGCTDNTEQIAKQYSLRHPQIQIRRNPLRLGKGRSIIEGFKVAAGDIILFVDADGSISPGETWKLVEGIYEENDVVISSRHLPQSQIVNGKSLNWRIASWGYNFLVRMFFGLKVKDTQCGAKVFKRSVIHSILDDIRSNGMCMDVELLWRAKQKNFNIKEVPIRWKHVQKNGVTSNLPRTVADMAIQIILLRFRIYNGKTKTNA